ncbi:hypothetical protein JCM10908_002142 [Rhodotorula pacifica]|uniref:uncharacterized protein n=1 Tax=Rhodotorula pacifica TaxID=1495444 RepID=UPI00316CAC19
MSEITKTEATPDAEPAAQETTSLARASFACLSSEICSRIVKLAHMQDQKTSEMGLPGGGTIAALSLVNKRLRELALPFLITTVKPSQLHSMTFRYGKIPETLLAQIRCLDLGHANESDTLAAARSLHQFKNLEELVVSCEASQVLCPDAYNPKEKFHQLAEHSFARDAFKRYAKCFQSLVQREPCDTYGNDARRLIQAVTVPAALKKLCLRRTADYTYFAPHSDTLRTTLVGCQALEELEILENGRLQYDIDEPVRAEWLGDMSLPAIKSLTLPARSFAVSNLLHAWVPEITTLAIDFTYSYDPIISGLSARDLNGESDSERVFTFAKLRNLTLSGPLVVLQAFKHLDVTCLEDLSVTIKTGTVREVDLVDFDPSRAFGEIRFPRGLRLDLSLPYQAMLSTVAWEPFRHTCAEHDITLTVHADDKFAPFKGDFLSSGAFSQDQVVRERCVAIAGALQSAGERLEWLGRLQDMAGLMELAEAVANVAELEMASRI